MDFLGQNKQGISRRKAGGKKHEQFMRVHPLFQGGKIFFCEELQGSPDMKELLEELGYVTWEAIASTHDDGLDAISMLPGIGNLWTAYTVASDIKDNINTNTTNTEQQKPSSKATENINKTNNTHNTINENNPKESKKSGFFKNLLKYGLPAYAATEIISSLFSSDEDVKSNDYKTDYNVEGKKLSNDFELNKTKEEIKAQSNKNNSSDLSETLSKTLDKDKEINDKKFEAFRNDLKEIKELLGQLINVSGAHAEISNVSAKASQIIAGNSMVKDYYEHNSNYSFEFQN